MAHYVARHFEKEGITAEILTYHVYLPYPKSASVQLLEPEAMGLELREKKYVEDKDSWSANVIMPFHAYSPSAEVEGQVIYVNYGLREDYAKLKELGVDVRGRIVLARYGQTFRGAKARIAEKNGAVGILIYSDPLDDGYFQGDVFPKGPFRPPSGVERGSVQYLFIYPGDPLTPGHAALEEAQRVPPQMAENLPRIPSHPLSYQDASPILKRLTGPAVPEGWQGALPFTYHLGPGASRVRIKLEVDYAIRPILNVIGRIPGAIYPDEWVIVGNHMDAWTFGAADANSGTTALLEMARGLGKAQAQGFRPKRTIVLAAWGAEEYGLIGSTEWGEDLKAQLMQKAVAYLNVDIGVSGSHFQAAAVPALQGLVRETSRFVKDRGTDNSVYETWLSQQPRESDRSTEVSVGDLGSGSDYTVFLDHLGVPSLTMGFRGPYGVYHSRYDSHYWMSRFGDANWSYHPALTQLWGRMALRLANADVFPFLYGDYGRAIVRHLQTQQRQDAAIDTFSIDWQPLLEQAHDMEKIGDEISAGTVNLLEKSLEPAKVRRINALFRQAERAFLLEEGLPGRPWFRHVIYAPGLYTGYASKPLPGLSQSIEDGEYSLAAQQALRLLRRLREVNQIRRLTH